MFLVLEKEKRVDSMSILEKITDNSDITNMSYDKLSQLALEIRKKLVDVVAQNGGHLASNLGAVELTLALHKVYNPEVDKIVWDVGHQSYVHKMLTGRLDKIDTIRKFGGLSGFTRASESSADCYDSGHSSTSISTALGYAYARDLNKDDYNVVAVIGDGALTGGLAFEGINNASHLKTNITVVLNNNEMSISPNVGGISKYLNKFRTGKWYAQTKQKVTQVLSNMPSGDGISKSIKHVKDTVKYMFVKDMLFEELGFTCIGPIDGHDIKSLTEAFEMARKTKGPVLVHVLTKKGAGYEFAEKNPGKFHGIGKFDASTGEAVAVNGGTKLSGLVGNTISNLAENNEKIVAITAAMPDGTGLSEFAKRYPERFFDVGIAEGHAATFAGGLARGGFTPVVAVYSSFLQRAYDNIVHDVAMRNLHTVFMIDRAGLVGEDGESHHGLLDIAYMTAMPNMAVLAPSNVEMLKQMISFAVNEYDGCIAIRYPRELYETEEQTPFEFGRGEVVREGSAVTVVTCGSFTSVVKEAVGISGVDAEIIDVRTIKPVDKELILKSYDKTGAVITVEDGVVNGGLGSIVSDLLPCKVKKIGYENDISVPHGSIQELMEYCKTDAKSIAEIILKEVSGK